MSIGGTIFNILTDPYIDIAESRVVSIGNKHRENVIIFKDHVRNIVINDNNLITVVPSKLPVLTKPKPFLLKDDGKIELGGYLNNDNLFVEYIFYKKPVYTHNTIILPENKIINLVNGMSSIPYKINNDTL